MGAAGATPRLRTPLEDTFLTGQLSHVMQRLQDFPRPLRHWACSAALMAGLAHAQAPFPPLAAVQATTVSAALAAMSIPIAEPTTYVLLDLPEVAAPGKIKARIGSEYPGTSTMLLLRFEPEFLPETKPSKPRANKPEPRPMPALIVARKFKPGEKPLLEAEFDITRTQRYLVFVNAQGRWFGVEREVKVGKDADSHR